MTIKMTTKQAFSIVANVQAFETEQAASFAEKLEAIYMPLGRLVAYRDQCKAAYNPPKGQTITQYMKAWDENHGLKDQHGKPTINPAYLTHARWLFDGNLELAKKTAIEEKLTSLGRIYQHCKPSGQNASKGHAETTSKGKATIAKPSKVEAMPEHAKEIAKAMSELMKNYNTAETEEKALAYINQAIVSLTSAMLKDHGLTATQWQAFQKTKAA